MHNIHDIGLSWNRITETKPLEDEWKRMHVSFAPLIELLLISLSSKCSALYI